MSKQKILFTEFGFRDGVRINDFEDAFYRGNENIFYTESQGEKRDKEILERYRVIINYFAENPDRIKGNWSHLYNIHMLDKVLKINKNLAILLKEKIIRPFELIVFSSDPI